MEIVSYDKINLVLTVNLLNEMRYDYFDLPFEIYMKLVNGSSPIDFFNSNIWNGGYEYRANWPDLNALLKSMDEIMLVDGKININTKRADGDTPLHIACVWGDISAVELLVNSGADLNVKGDMSCTPIYNAVSFGHHRCVKLLLDAGASYNDENELNFTAEEKGLMSSDPRMIELFKKA